MTRLLLALLLSQAADPPPKAVRVRDGYVRTFESDEAIQVRGGAYLPSPVLQKNGQELAKLRADNEELKSAQPASLLIVSGICLVAGFILGGYTVYKLK